MAKIQILGSAAAEAIPAIFCNCRVCREAWKNGGKDMRLRAAYKLNDHVRIDFGPDSIAQEYRYQLHSENLKHLFITDFHCYCGFDFSFSGGDPGHAGTGDEVLRHVLILSVL